MRTLYKPLSPYGFEQVIIEEDMEVPAGHTDIEPPTPNWKPLFNWEANEWIELATDEEKQGSAVDDITEIEQLKQENEELRQRVDMSDEALLELADMVLTVADSMKGGA